MRSSVLIGRLTADLRTRAGAIVDSGPGQVLDVMAGPALRGALGLREFERLSFEPGVADATFIDYDASLVDRLATVVNGLGRVARVQPPTIARKPIDAAAAIDRGVTIHNGVHRYQSHEAVDATYVGATFEYTVLADERMGAVVTTWGNPATRFMASLESRIDRRHYLTIRTRPKPRSGQMDRPSHGRWLLRPLARASRQGSPTFSSGSAGGVSATCGGCVSITRRSISRSGASSRAPGWTTICAGASAIVSTSRTAHFTRAVRKWPNRYRVRLRLSPIGVWLCRLPAYYIKVKLMRRNAAADTVFSWNPIDGRIEPRACDGCLAPTDSAWLCDDAVHYVCDDCLAACRKCSRRFCRACMHACPRPHARE
jgi:hypothetical protein